ncbi:copper resistance protein NlpE N-terminal domain-containing protein [Aquiflexum lacus]|uniref:copper resistance protein NlpE N-terminal domain-containing protein n=1 Tax=Aquiflexum lacus TaxID=2483805 RepID=UPI0018937AF8|nr:copper resistance protein NlpE N-terminal domain-containing protein [Aquiflexum lacus]
MKNKVFLSSIIIVLMSFSCSSKKVVEKEEILEINPSMASNSRNSLDWKGVYKGTTPCADCEGIETSITLKSDETFQRSIRYLGKDDNYFFDEGIFLWNEAGSKVTLETKDGNSQQYQVGENVLFHLDREGNRITGDLAENYKLAKNPVDPRLEDKNWILKELMEKPIEIKEGDKEAFLLFNMETSTFSGNGSCNNIFGSYELKEGNRISFGNAGATMMACEDMETERMFLEMISKVDNYSISEGTLSLNKAKMAPLARFELEENK